MTISKGNYPRKGGVHENMPTTYLRPTTIPPPPPTGASEASEETKHWRGKPLFVNNGLPLQCFVCSEHSDASAPPPKKNPPIIYRMNTTYQIMLNILRDSRQRSQKSVYPYLYAYGLMPRPTPDSNT